MIVSLLRRSRRLAATMTTVTVQIPADWPATEERARAVQDELRVRVVLDEPGPAPGTGRVTGVDVAYDGERDVIAAAAVVLDAATLAVVAEATAVGRICFPYVPGLLAFREIPTVLAALDALPCPPGLVVCDGYGLAQPAPLRPRQSPRRAHRTAHGRRGQEPVHLHVRRPGRAPAVRPRCSPAPRRSDVPSVPATVSSRSSSPSAIV